MRRSVFIVALYSPIRRKDDDGYISRIEGKCMETEGIGPADMRLAHVEASAVGSRAAEDETDAAVKETVSSNVSAPRSASGDERRERNGPSSVSCASARWPRRSRAGTLMESLSRFLIQYIGRIESRGTG